MPPMLGNPTSLGASGSCESRGPPAAVGPALKQGPYTSEHPPHTGLRLRAGVSVRMCHYLGGWVMDLRPSTFT